MKRKIRWFSFFFSDDGSCWRMTHLAKKTDTPGRFTFHSQGEYEHTPTRGSPARRYSSLTCLFLLSSVWDNDNDMRIVDVVYDNYALVHTIKTKDGVSEVLNKLYSKSHRSFAPLGVGAETAETNKKVALLSYFFVLYYLMLLVQIVIIENVKSFIHVITWPLLPSPSSASNKKVH